MLALWIMYLWIFKLFRYLPLHVDFFVLSIQESGDQSAGQSNDSLKSEIEQFKSAISEKQTLHKDLGEKIEMAKGELRESLHKRNVMNGNIEFRFKVIC